jgi:hypothetical protein
VSFSNSRSIPLYKTPPARLRGRSTKRPK